MGPAGVRTTGYTSPSGRNTPRQQWPRGASARIDDLQYRPSSKKISGELGTDTPATARPMPRQASDAYRGDRLGGMPTRRERRQESRFHVPKRLTDLTPEPRAESSPAAISSEPLRVVRSRA